MNSMHQSHSTQDSQADYSNSVDIILSSHSDCGQFVVRSCCQAYSQWKARYHKSGSPFSVFSKGKTQEAAIVDGEVWVFGIDPIKAQDIATAVKIAMNYFNVSADNILQDVYVKDLNASQDNAMLRQALLISEKRYYQSVCLALIQAAEQLNCNNKLNFWVYGSSSLSKASNNRRELINSYQSGGLSEMLKAKFHLTALNV